MDYSLGPFSDRTETLLRGFAETLEEPFDNSEALPPVLWHYTETDGVRAIIDSSRLRLSHARFLNDPTEIAFGWDVATKALESAISSATNLKAFFGMTRTVSGEVYHAEHYFTFCLSARPDSLSQWRAYGGGGEGYALGFDSSRILRATEPDVTCVLVRMRYTEKDRSDLLELGISAATKFWNTLLERDVKQEDRLGIAHRANLPLSRFIMRAALSFKDASFKDEQEWRLVTGFHPDDSESASFLKKVCFRSGAGIVKPYLDLPINPGEVQLPISQIMFGPTLRPDITRESLEFFLTRRGYSGIPVVQSVVPLQA
jgi:hypothetical protein